MHASWRLAVARTAADAYAGNRRLAAFVVAGSVGAGLADEFSDLELDCYWSEPPSDRDRLAPIESLGGRLEAFWDFDADDEEWSEDYRIGQLDVTVSNFTVGSVERFIDAVTVDADTDPVKHMRLAAIQRGLALQGADLDAGWRDRAGAYPDALVLAMVEQSLAPGALPGWSAREAMISRGDEIALHALLVAVERAVIGALLAVNRIYAPHRVFKWQRSLLAEFRIAPDRLAERLASLWLAGTEAIEQAEALLAETVVLAETVAGVDLAEFRAALAERRAPVDPPGRA